MSRRFLLRSGAICDGLWAGRHQVHPNARALSARPLQRKASGTAAVRRAVCAQLAVVRSRSWREFAVAQFVASLTEAAAAICTNPRLLGRRRAWHCGSPCWRTVECLAPAEAPPRSNARAPGPPCETRTEGAPTQGIRGGGPRAERLWGAREGKSARRSPILPGPPEAELRGISRECSYLDLVRLIDLPGHRGGTTSDIEMQTHGDLPWRQTPWK